MKQYMEMIGQVVGVKMESFVVECKIVDFKMAYGQVRFCVEPVAGFGQQFVMLDRIVKN